MSEEIKTEGEFKVKKQTPKKLNKVDQVTKVTISDSEPATATEPEVTKVFITNETETTDAVQEQNTNESMLGSEGSQVGLQEVVQGNEESKIVTSQEEEVTVINEITEEEIAENEKLWKEERDEPELETTQGQDLRAIGITPGALESDIEMGQDMAGIEQAGGAAPAPGGVPPMAGGAAGPTAAPAPAAPAAPAA